MNVIVFDLGGTLMTYAGMPYSWVDFYSQGFEAIIQKYKCCISKEQVDNSLQLLVNFNPRVSKREIYGRIYFYRGTGVLEIKYIDSGLYRSILEWSEIKG